MHYEQSFYLHSPSPDLAPYVGKFYQIVGYTSPEFPHRDTLLPRPTVTMNFHFEEKICLNQVPYDGNNIPAVNISGCITQPAQVLHDRGNADVFGIIFNPGTFYYFTRLPMLYLTDNILESRCLLGIEVNELAEKLYDAGHFKQRVRVSEEYLRQKLRWKSYRPGLNEQVMNWVAQHGGNVTLQATAQRFNLSEKHLDRLFRQQVGISVKFFARNLRFQTLLRELKAAPEPKLAKIADQTGFFDVSHLAKEFNLFAGEQPASFLRRDTRIAMTFAER